MAEDGITEGYDDFVRGWIGTGREYPKGVIHFVPCVDKRNVKLFDRAFDTLEMFRENGALASTVIRGFGGRWEQPFSDILTDMWEAERSKYMNAEWIPHMKAYRLYDACHPQQTVAYAENANMAEQRAMEEGYAGLVLCDAGCRERL